MYIPYLRARRFELLALRNALPVLQRFPNILPVLEPVNSDPAELIRAATTLTAGQCRLGVITNPAANGRNGVVQDMLQLPTTPPALRAHPMLIPTLLVLTGTTVAEITTFFATYMGRALCIVHAEPPAAPTGAQTLATNLMQHHSAGHALIHVGRDGMPEHYRAMLPAGPLVLQRDGFRRQANNAAYPASSFYTDLHRTYTALGYDGWSDYLTVGDFFSDGGGSPLAVVLHLAYLGLNADVWMAHFMSNSNATTADPAGKFAQAAAKIAPFLAGHPPALATAACQELLAYAAQSHFPGLGKLKELSMRHHLELVGPYA